MPTERRQRRHLIASRHAEQRIRKRLGLPRRAVARWLAQADQQGLRRPRMSGGLRAYCDELAHKRAYACDVMLHGGVVLLVRDRRVVTVWQVPKRLEEEAVAASTAWNRRAGGSDA